MMALEGASFGLQLGGQATNFVVLLMNPRSASSVLSSKVKARGRYFRSGGTGGGTIRPKPM
jgi:lipid-binding SYLF domain-containing protein